MIILAFILRSFAVLDLKDACDVILSYRGLYNDDFHQFQQATKEIFLYKSGLQLTKSSVTSHRTDVHLSTQKLYYRHMHFCALSGSIESGDEAVVRVWTFYGSEGNFQLIPETITLKFMYTEQRWIIISWVPTQPWCEVKGLRFESQALEFTAFFKQVNAIGQNWNSDMSTRSWLQFMSKHVSDRMTFEDPTVNLPLKLISHKRLMLLGSAWMRKRRHIHLLKIELKMNFQNCMEGRVWSENIWSEKNDEDIIEHEQMLEFYLCLKSEFQQYKTICGRKVDSVTGEIQS